MFLIYRMVKQYKVKKFLCRSSPFIFKDKTTKKLTKQKSQLNSIHLFNVIDTLFLFIWFLLTLLSGSCSLVPILNK